MDQYRVLCTLPNASTQIGGIKFEPTEGGMLSEPLDEAQAKRLCGIPGYSLANGNVADVLPADFDKMSANDIIAYLADYPDQAGAVEAWELEHKGQNARKTVIEAVRQAREGQND